MSSVRGWRLEWAAHHPGIPQCVGYVQSNDKELMESQHDMLHRNLFPSVYIYFQMFTFDLSLLISFTFYRMKK